MVVYENRSVYLPEKDAVATVTLTLECSPGQVENLSNFLIGVSAKAGVYSVAMDHTVALPQNEGEAHAEPEVQRNAIEPEAAVVSEGSQPEEGGEVGLELQPDAGAHGELAGPAGESAVEGSEPGSA